MTYDLTPEQFRAILEAAYAYGLEIEHFQIHRELKILIDYMTSERERINEITIVFR
jgi:hypothetical protein